MATGVADVSVAAGNSIFGVLSPTHFLYVSVFLSACYIVLTWKWPENLPPGPKPYPVIGNVFSFLANARRLQYYYKDLALQYGPIVSVNYGGQVVVVLNDAATIREALGKRGGVFSDRPPAPSIHTMTNGRQGVVLSNGPVWKDQRSYALVLLRDFGLGKLRFEEKIKFSIGPLLDFLRDTDGNPVDAGHEIEQTVSDVIGNVAFSSLYDRNSPEILSFNRCVRENFEATTPLMTTDFFKFLRYLPGDLFKIKQTERNGETMATYIRKSFREHRKSFDKNNVRDLVDAYIAKIDESSGTDVFTETNATQVIAEMYMAGVDTSSNTLKWAFLFMALHPDVQAKIRDELPPPNSEITWADREKYPYTEAAILEIMRIEPVAPFAVPHGTAKATTYMGYDIPQDTAVLPNIWLVQNDPRIWKNPRTFDVQHFLNDDGSLKKDLENMMPFSTGRRQCIGESLAKMEVFLFFTSVIQNFRLELPDSKKPPSLDQPFRFSNAPMPYTLKFSPVAQ